MLLNENNLVTFSHKILNTCRRSRKNSVWELGRGGYENITWDNHCVGETYLNQNKSFKSSSIQINHIICH